MATPYTNETQQLAMSKGTLIEWIRANGKEILIGLAILLALYIGFRANPVQTVYVPSNPVQIVATPALPEYVGMPVSKPIMCTTSNPIVNTHHGLFSSDTTVVGNTSTSICGYEQTVEYVRVK